MFQTHWACWSRDCYLWIVKVKWSSLEFEFVETGLMVKNNFQSIQVNKLTSMLSTWIHQLRLSKVILGQTNLSFEKTFNSEMTLTWAWCLKPLTVTLASGFSRFIFGSFRVFLVRFIEIIWKWPVWKWLLSNWPIFRENIIHRPISVIGQLNVGHFQICIQLGRTVPELCHLVMKWLPRDEIVTDEIFCKSTCQPVFDKLLDRRLGHKFFLWRNLEISNRLACLRRREAHEWWIAEDLLIWKVFRWSQVLRIPKPSRALTDFTTTFESINLKVRDGQNVWKWAVRWPCTFENFGLQFPIDKFENQSQWQKLAGQQ